MYNLQYNGRVFNILHKIYKRKVEKHIFKSRWIEVIDVEWWPGRWTDRRTDRQTNGRTGREISRQTDRYKWCGHVLTDYASIFHRWKALCCITTTTTPMGGIHFHVLQCSWHDTETECKLEINKHQEDNWELVLAPVKLEHSVLLPHCVVTLMRPSGLGISLHGQQDILCSTWRAKPESPPNLNLLSAVVQPEEVDAQLHSNTDWESFITFNSRVPSGGWLKELAWITGSQSKRRTSRCSDNKSSCPQRRGLFWQAIQEFGGVSLIFGLW